MCYNLYIKINGGNFVIKSIGFSREGIPDYFDKYNQKLSKINGLNKVNIFVGENNSGKSRLMRKILLLETADLYDDLLPNNDLKSQEKEYRRKLINGMKLISKYFDGELKKNVLDLEQYSFLELYEKAYDIINLIELNEKEKVDLGEFNSAQQILESYFNVFLKKSGQNAKYRLNSNNSCYIPILRGIENFEKFFDDIGGLENIKMTIKENEFLNLYINQSKAIYKNKVSKIYTIKKECVFTAEELYDEITNKLLGSESDRFFISEFEKFISENFYNGVNFSIIPYKKGNYLNIKISNSEDRALYDMGEGVKQIIVLLYKMFEAKDKEMIFFYRRTGNKFTSWVSKEINRNISKRNIFKTSSIFINTF